MARDRDASADVLAVCTGNLCRSPMIAAVLSAAVPGLVVHSAGTDASRGASWHPSTELVLAEAGHPVRGQAHRLRAADVRGATLIVTAEARHRGVVATLDAAAGRRAFTVLEAARLLRRAPVPPGFGVVKLAVHLAEAVDAFPLAEDDDLADPLLGTVDDFRRCLVEVEAAVAVLAPALLPI